MGSHMSSIRYSNIISSKLTTQEPQTELMDQSSTLREKYLEWVSKMEEFEDLSRRKRVTEDFIIIWFDENLNKKDSHYLDLIAQTRQIVNDVETFDTVNDFINYLAEIKYEKVFLVVADPTNKTPWFTDYDSPQIASLYIFRSTETFSEDLKIQHRKLKGIYTEFDSLYDRLKYDIKQCDYNLVPLRVFNSSGTKASGSRNELDRLFPIWQLPLDILSRLDHSVDSRSEMIAFCRKHYATNCSALYKIDEFERNYVSDSALHWYTQDSFLYRILNHALRTQAIDTIYTFRYCLKDISDEIQLQNTKFGDRWKGTVYRGANISEQELEEYRYSVGGFVSCNSFISTSFEKEVALTFLGKISDELDLKAILFTISIHPSSSARFALTHTYSQSTDESEVLFSIGSIFRIIDVVQEPNGVAHATISLASVTSDCLPKLSNKMQSLSDELYVWNQCAQFYLRMGQYYKVQAFFQTLLERASNDNNQVACADMLHQLGYIFYRRYDFARALYLYEEALQLFEEAVQLFEKANEHMGDIAATYHNLGLIYRQQKDYDSSIEYFERTLAVIMKLPQFTQGSKELFQDLSCMADRINLNSAVLEQTVTNRTLVVDNTCLIVWLATDNNDDRTAQLLSEIQAFFPDIVVLDNAGELDHLMLAFQFAVKPLYLIVSHRNDEQNKAYLAIYKKYLQALYVVGEETRPPVNDDDVLRGVFGFGLPLIYRLATDIAERYQSFADEEFDRGDTKDGETHYQYAVDLYRKLAEYF